MNRRNFFKALGAVVAVVIAPPVLPATPVAQPIAQGSWIDLANAFAFNYVADFQRDFHGPRQERFYRERALMAAHRYMQGRQP